ncbi:hypothetical protein ABZ835_19030 [Streptomyces sp. NPDC047461]|uniref:hypothetical protein n=1 Tax=Streptomyces sp. NPDC047461 TaxID=3155619 RepID=UPI00340F0788
MRKAFEGAYGAFLRPSGRAQYAEKQAAALGEPVRFQSVPYDYFRTLEIPLAEELGNMFRFYGDFDREFTGARDSKFESN